MKRFLGPLLLLASLSGCAETYIADTILHADGSIDRAIYQPRSGTPKTAQSPEVWTAFQADSPADEWPKSIAGFPTELSDEHIVIWGKFASVDQIPLHYQWPADNEMSATLQPTYTRTDLVFVDMHTWNETLTEIVELGEARVAAKEAIHLLAEFLADVLTERFGADYDFSGLIEWADAEGANWFLELYDALVQSSFHRGEQRAKQFVTRFNKICEAHGLKLRDAAGRSPGDQDFSMDDGEVKKALSAFARLKLKAVIRSRDGQPVEDAVIDEILNEFAAGHSLKDFGEMFGPPDPEGQTTSPSALELAAERVVIRKFGNYDALEEKLSPLILRTIGVHLATIAPQEFRYSMRFPGFIVETNGQLKSNNQVIWMFDADLAFPAGYTMYGESVEPNVELQRQLLGKEPVNDQTSVLAYRNLIAQCPEILDIMKECQRQNSMLPLHRVGSGDTRQARAAKLMRELLGIEKKND